MEIVRDYEGSVHEYPTVRIMISDLLTHAFCVHADIRVHEARPTNGVQETERSRSSESDDHHRQEEPSETTTAPVN
jgi:hypothetical protein